MKKAPENGSFNFVYIDITNSCEGDVPSEDEPN
jgi:hypothetical protein